MNPIEKAAYLLRASGHPIAAAELEAELAWLKLDKPARVGNDTFPERVSAKLVVEAAQRHHQYAEANPCFGVWTSMEDGAPPGEEGEYLVVARVRDEEPAVRVDEWRELKTGAQTWFDWTLSDDGEVTHWMPLPEAPR